MFCSILFFCALIGKKIFRRAEPEFAVVASKSYLRQNIRNFVLTRIS